MKFSFLHRSPQAWATTELDSGNPAVARKRDGWTLPVQRRAMQIRVKMS
jgi:hypothetical protein